MLRGHWWKFTRGRRIRNVTFFQKSFYSRTAKFDLSYAFRTFDENFNDLKPVELVESEFGNKDPVFLFPGLDGKLKFIEDLAHNLKRPVYCFQYPMEKSTGDVSHLAKNITRLVKDYAKPEEKLNFVVHSYGSLYALSVVKEMQHSNKVHLCLLDSTPYAMKYMARASFGDISDRAKYENDLLVSVLHWMNVNDTKQFENVFENSSNWNEKLKHLVEMVPEHPKFSKRNLLVVINGVYNTSKAALLYDDQSLGKLNAKTTLIRPTEKILPLPDDFREQEYFSQPIKTLFVEGNHFNMLKSTQTANIVNRELEIV